MAAPLQSMSRRHYLLHFAVMVALTVGLPRAGSSQATDSLSSARIAAAIARDKPSSPHGAFQVDRSVAFFNAQNWHNFELWLYTDEQRFHTDGKYGPVAKIAPYDALDTLTESGFIAGGSVSGGILLGAVKVDTNPMRPQDLPAAYTGLRLAPGWNCVLAARTAGVWRGYIFAERGGTDPCAMPTNPHELRLRRVGHSDFDGFANLAPVGRFHEGKNNGNKSRPHFGLKCGDYWCMFMPMTNHDSMPLAHRNLHPRRRSWEVHGWHDVQRLAERRGTGLVPGNLRSSIIADSLLGEYDMRTFATWTHVATVHFRGNPAGTKYGRRPSGSTGAFWNFVNGENEIFLRVDASKPKGWAAEVRNRQGTFELVIVDRDDHTGKHIPGTARWHWDPQDEGAWVRCDDGCCKIAPG
jgi:hypothetical protein